jgi:PAS domain S-box-containing protein
MKILVAEDHPESRYLLQQLFSGLGHEVSAVADGLEVLELLGNSNNTPPDAIVSDALMPRMDGFQLCRALRQHPRWCRLPFIFYTATYTDRADEQFALKIGADRFVVKPVEPDELMAVIADTIAKVKAAPPREARPLDADATVLEEYTHRLSLKLELKVAELEGANEDLRASEQAIRQLNDQLTSTVRALEKEVAVRQEAEASLRIREEVLRYAQNLGQTGSFLRDLETQDMIWSDEAFRICGFEPVPGPVSHEWMSERIHPEDRERVLTVLRTADSDRTGFEVEHRILRPDGVVRHVFVRRHIYRDADGRPRRAIGIIQDITDRKQAEGQRTRLETQLRQAQKMEAIGNLAGGIAHDFNNILTAIMAHAELLDLELPRETTGPHLRDSVHEILTASGRARDMVRQILTFSRKQPVERKRIEIDPVVQDALRLVKVTLPPSVELRVDLNAQRAVMANEAQIHQIVLNLCTNAAQAMGTVGGAITVSLSVADLDDARVRSRPPLRTGEHVLLEIRDNGCGMDAVTVERIFEPFFTTKGVGQGTGLGLAVVHGAVQAHDGAIFVESTPGKGTVFSVYLPALKNPPAGKAGATVAPMGGTGQKILFVDDEPSVAKIGARLLERLGYKAVALTDPVAARDRLVNNPQEFDLVITDYLMPRVTGLDLSRAAWAVRPDLPMILAVGFGGQLDATRAKAHGFKEFVAKPFAIQTLADAIVRALGGGVGK